MRARAAASLLASLTIAGCRDATGPGTPSVVRVDPQWVTGEAAAALDPATGLFILPDAPAKHVSAEEARELAAAVADEILAQHEGSNGDSFLERVDRRGKIDYGHLVVCARSTYVLNPWGELAPDAPNVMRHAFAAHWAVPLCGRDGTAHVSVGVSDNQVEAPHEQENAPPLWASGVTFTITGVPARFPSGLPVTPEAAVAEVVRLTGRRVSRVPVAFDQHNGGFGNLPLCASWRVELEAPVAVTVEESGDIVETQVLYVRHTPACYSDTITLFVASANQPASRWILFPAWSSLDQPPTMDSVLVEYAGPSEFERVTILP